MSHDLLRHDPDVGYTFVPGTRVRVPHETGGYLVSANALGFRSGEVEGNTADDVFVFGDSFTAGDGVSNGKRWTDELGRLLPDRRFHNFGLPGTGTDQQYLAWRKFAAHRPCRLVVAAVLVENVKRVTVGFRPADTGDGRVLWRAKPYFELAGDDLVLHHHPVPAEPVDPDAVEGPTYTGGRFPALRRLVNRVGLKELVQQMTAYQPVPDYDAPDTPGWRLLSAILERWSRECAAPMAIVPLPLYQHVEGTADPAPYQARFAELGARLNRPVIDPLPALRAHDAATRRGFRFAKDVHLTPEGHLAVARAIAPGLRDLLSKPA